MSLSSEIKEMFPEAKEPKKYRTVKMIFENDFDRTIQEITLKSEYMDGVSFNDLMNTFRQFVLALGYSEDTAKMILSVSEDDLENLGINKEDLYINNYER